MRRDRNEIAPCRRVPPGAPFTISSRYVLPGLRTFDSWTELIGMLERADFRAISAELKEHNAEQKAMPMPAHACTYT